MSLVKYEATEDVLETLKQEFKSGESQINRLEFTEVRFDRKIATKLSEILKLPDSPLEELHFKRCMLKFISLKKITEPLKIDLNIRALSFVDVTIHEKEATLLSEMIEQNHAIEELTIVHCGINDASMIKLSKGLGKNKIIRYLDFRNNVFES